jgi:penicillin amidase
MGWTLAYRNLERQRRRTQALVGSDAADALFPTNGPIQEPIQANGRSAPRFDYAALPPPGEPDPVAARETQAWNLAFGPDEWSGSAFGDLRPATRSAGPPVRRSAALSEEAVLGSNNWAVMPLKTEGRNAMLAGDPHLNLTLPSIWYEAHVLVPGVLDVYGVTIPGVPGITIGFNRNVAWSFTNSGADVMDFYTETLDDPAQPERYLLDDDWRPLVKRIEEYRNRSGTVIAVDTIYHTHRGPLLMEDGEALSLRWTVLEEQGEMSAFSGIAKASTVDEWLAAMESYVAPAQNGIVADRNGSIAVRASGWFPIRPGDGRGDKVRDGSQSANDWQGYWPVGKYPFSIDPGQGYLASANQQPIDPRVDDAYLGADWPSPWRAMQINRLLREGSRLTSADLQRFQTDPGSARADLFVAEFLEAAERLLAAGRGDTLLEDAARLLQEWDRRYTKDNKRAILFELAMNELTWRTWDELHEPQHAPTPPQRQVQFPASQVLASLLPDSSSAWWDDRRTPRVEDRDAILGSSLQNGLMIARQRYGNEDEGGWRWDRVRHANIYHLLGLPSLSALELPLQGGPSTINPLSGNGTHGASWRMVVELGSQVRAWSIYPGGQSGNPISSRYEDRLEEWMSGALDEVLFPVSSDQLPPERVMSTLLLSPEN